MKTPIEVKDIRVGDRVRCEMKSAAHEFVARIKGDRDGWNHPKFVWFLLDRPRPPAELPNSVTIGRLTWRDGDAEKSLTTIWRPEVYDGHKAWMVSVEPDESVRGSDVIAWVPMVAVPKAAYDRLKDSDWTDYYETKTFIHAVERANR